MFECPEVFFECAAAHVRRMIHRSNELSKKQETLRPYAIDLTPEEIGELEGLWDQMRALQSGTGVGDLEDIAKDADRTAEEIRSARARGDNIVHITFYIIEPSAGNFEEQKPDPRTR